MAADELEMLREQLEQCTDPGKRLALMKRIRELEKAKSKVPQFRQASEGRQTPERPAGTNQDPTRS